MDVSHSHQCFFPSFSSSLPPLPLGKTKKEDDPGKNMKICQETHLKWDQALPIALLQIRVVPQSELKVSPFEMVYGRPF